MSVVVSENVKINHLLQNKKVIYLIRVLSVNRIQAFNNDCQGSVFLQIIPEL